MVKVGAQWLSLRLQFIGVFVSVCVAAFAIICSNLDLFSVDEALLGLTMIYSMTVVFTLNGLVSFFAEFEQAMVSVERVNEYIKISGESTERDPDIENFASSVHSSANSIKYAPLLTNPTNQVRDTHLDMWPMDGSLSFTSTSMSYRPTLPPSLRNLTIDIAHGEKIAIIGRTGSGKSSLFRVLLRMNEYSGSLKISGHELRHIPHELVRKSLAVIPQDPLIFSGTLAFNLDPGQIVSSDELSAVVDQIDLFKGFSHLLASVTTSSLLDYEILNSGENLSQGQKQLICLGRAMLRKSKLLLIDEATASLDDYAESIFFDALRRNFKNSTILMICHKVDKATKFCDKVCFLNQFNFDDLSIFSSHFFENLIISSDFGTEPRNDC